MIGELNTAEQILLRDVQMNRVFPDGKTFPDCLPNGDPEKISEKYVREKDQPGFDLKKFVFENFTPPAKIENTYVSDTNRPVEENIEKLWEVLTRKPDTAKGTLIPLPHPYIVPGGRFGEIYYWDSYFTMQGLLVSGKYEMIENMVKNLSYLIDTIGYIPNGNRSYFIGRSQPPFYSLMVKLLSGINGSEVLVNYLPQLIKEHNFWMKGSDSISNTDKKILRICRMPGGELLNHYWDDNETPRPESYREDVELSHSSREDPKILFRQLRAGAESGWDFSSRWFKEKNSFESIHTTEIIPVDLNCLLVHLEEIIAEAYRLKGEYEPANRYQLLAAQRKEAIQKYCWNDELGFYVDYDAEEQKQKTSITLAGVFPMAFNISSPAQSNRVATLLENKFLKSGGLITTLETTSQQWDAPNGWPPLQWMTIWGLENYGHTVLAGRIAKIWIRLNTEVFKRTGKLMEKYNVVDTQLEAGGGEYPGQDGFGWTNGILLALIKKYGPAAE
jgi:alpha,alpha-trehalase